MANKILLFVYPLAELALFIMVCGLGYYVYELNGGISMYVVVSVFALYVGWRFVDRVKIFYKSIRGSSGSGEGQGSAGDGREKETEGTGR